MKFSEILVGAPNLVSMLERPVGRLSGQCGYITVLNLVRDHYTDTPPLRPPTLPEIFKLAR